MSVFALVLYLFFFQASDLIEAFSTSVKFPGPDKVEHSEKIVDSL